MQLIAHRGHHQRHPENSMGAFIAASEVGFAGIETDVRLSADGELILFHDRLSPEDMPVAQLTRHELSQQCGYEIPLLADALDELPNMLWNIEIKTLSAATPAIEVLHRYQESHNLLVTSFRHDIVLQASKDLISICGFLNAHRPVAINTLLHAALDRPNLRTLVWDFEILDESLLQQANALGFHNFVYGAHTRWEHELVKDYGCHGIITDHPNFVGLG